MAEWQRPPPCAARSAPSGTEPRRAGWHRRRYRPSCPRLGGTGYTGRGLALCVSARAAAAAAAAQLIEGGVQLTRIKGVANFNFFTPIPPMCVTRIKNTLLAEGFGHYGLSWPLQPWRLGLRLFFYPGNGVPRVLALALRRLGFHLAAVRCALAAHRG